MPLIRCSDLHQWRWIAKYRYWSRHVLQADEVIVLVDTHPSRPRGEGENHPEANRRLLAGHL